MLHFKPQFCFFFVRFCQNCFDVIWISEISLSLERCHSESCYLNRLLHVIIQYEPFTIYFVNDSLDMSNRIIVCTAIPLYTVIYLLHQFIRHCERYIVNVSLWSLRWLSLGKSLMRLGGSINFRCLLLLLWFEKFLQLRNAFFTSAGFLEFFTTSVTIFPIVRPNVGLNSPLARGVTTLEVRMVPMLTVLFKFLAHRMIHFALIFRYLFT